MIKKKIAALFILCLTASSCHSGPIGNRDVPEPAKAVDIQEYSGLWYEIARYENRFEKGCEAVTAEYRPLKDGKLKVINSCHQGAVDGPREVAEGKAKVVSDSQNAKLKVSFFGPFYLGDYWVLDRAEDYSWSIVGEPSGRYLWILARQAHLPDKQKEMLISKVEALGYDTKMLYFPKHP